MNRVGGKVAIVTGAASGIGAATAHALVHEGANVVLTDLDEISGAKNAEALGTAARFHRQDVSKEGDWRSVVLAAEEQFGPVSILVNCAGIIAKYNNEGPIAEMNLADYQHVIDVNQTGTFLGIKHAIPSMVKAGGGSIVTLSSVGGLAGMPFLAGYISSKFAVTGLTKVAALELGKSGIRVNSVHPGAIETPIHYRGQTEEELKAMREWLAGPVSKSTLGRMAQPEEVAQLILFLASNESSFCTGAEFVVDGGLLAQT